MNLLPLILLLLGGWARGYAAETDPTLATRTARSALPPAITAPDASLESPVALFRELLALPEAEREKRLAGKSESQRKVLLAKLDEYSRLRPEDRDARLLVLQLRLYLMPLMKAPRDQRGALLRNIPPEWRTNVEERLKLWDILPPPLQTEVLDKETARYYFLRLEASSPAERQALLAQLPAAKRQEMEAGLQQWRTLPQEERQRIYARLDSFMQLTEEEKARTLNVLKNGRRERITLTLQSLQKLPKDQRDRCLAAFQKFVAMSSAERDQFLAKVERWKDMSDAERQVWRDMASALPPFPPGLNPPSFPPLPR